MKRDYYEILEIPRAASHTEIKAAYRKKALEFHPDRNPDHQAEDLFKETSEAYEVLSDSNKRAVYDQFGHQGLDRQGMHHGYADVGDIFSHFGDIFEEFFGFGSSPRHASGPRGGRDLRFDLEVDFLKAYRGTEENIEVKKEESCEKCDGQGYPPGETPRTCPDCSGTGQLLQSQGFFTISATCRACAGKGQVVDKHCEDCQGRGVVSKEKTLKVKIPPGVDHGMRLCLRGEGEPGQRGGSPGDLYVVLHVDSHPRYHRQGNDLIVQENVSMVEAALGSETQVEVPESWVSLKIPPGTQTGDTLRIRGLGMPDVQYDSRGDILVQIFVETPKKLSKKQKELLQALQDTFPKKTKKKKEESSFTKSGKGTKKSKRSFW